MLSAQRERLRGTLFRNLRGHAQHAPFLRTVRDLQPDLRSVETRNFAAMFAHARPFPPGKTGLPLSLARTPARANLPGPGVQDRQNWLVVLQEPTNAIQRCAWIAHLSSESSYRREDYRARTESFEKCHPGNAACSVLPADPPQRASRDGADQAATSRSFERPHH